MWKKGSPSATTIVQQRQEEQSARNELFAGKDEIHIDTTQIPLADQTVGQLVDTAVRTHKDTTAATQRALRAIEESKQIQSETLKQLEDQDKTMSNIRNRMDHINEELTYAEKLLSYMRRCCCLWVCDSCTGADPEEQRKKEWKSRVDRGETRPGASAATGYSKGGGGSAGVAKTAAAGGRAGTSGGDRGGEANGGGDGGRRGGDPDIRLPSEYRATEMRLHEETRRQNDMIDQIHAGLNQLLEGAKVMHDELASQNRELDVLDSKAAATRDRINDVNKNSQLRDFGRGKPKAKKEDMLPTLPTQSEAAVAAAKRLAGL
ncbi:hypothetical protein VOLCADRAFT_104786 [Volvox carteri f. nagariensis]|uniref:Uncharacterized protein snap34 n=1 Tax=Volvox carteri f. nagariensis TaxID=3068 RepID=D8TW14_VOLCA|nr:uncharacterized protein VOLCADRAFT_104786 [Volvox carteri f. nagariensis]EFJ48399.1 hypothetical protein VOLCADRAFT_104786 [Volvox carteri f. nagariensis]|eukprot:XP_002950653.1 hypothetical protein VOLCADRAFT_104786 [Volvox carteri f. nagariensis]